MSDEARSNIRVGKNADLTGLLVNDRSVGGICQSVDEQIRLLIDLATDGNILARQYHGLELWC